MAAARSLRAAGPVAKASQPSSWPERSGSKAPSAKADSGVGRALLSDARNAARFSSTSRLVVAASAIPSWVSARRPTCTRPSAIFGASSRPCIS